MKWFFVKYGILTVIGIALYKVCAAAAFAQRGYSAVGGEVFILLLPVIYYLIEETVSGMKGRR